MKRRTILQGGIAAGVSALWPSWLAHAFDPASSCEDMDSAALLFDAYRSARRRGEPLLVLVIPQNDRQKYRRGELLGQALNHGDDETLASLSLVTLVCATMADVAKLVPVPVASDDEPLLVRIDSLVRPARAQSFAAPAPVPSKTAGYEYGDERHWAFLIDAVDQEIRDISAVLRQATEFRSAREAEPALSADAERLFRALANGEQVEARRARAAARPLWQRAAHAARAERRRVVHALAEAMRSDFKKPIPGSRWAIAACGLQIEDEPPNAVACGMGMTPEKSGRLLYLFTRAPGE